MIKFSPEGHSYTSADNRKWLSITGIVDMLTPPFTSTPEKCSVRKSGKFPNKWYGVSPDKIRKAWDDENKRSTELGKWYHDKRESALYEPDMQLMWSVVPPIVEDGIKLARDQKLTSGIYPEHLVYLESASICGQSDYVKVQDDILGITDYKTSKEIRKKGFETWEGEKMMLEPLQHLGDCEFNHYAIQLSMYAYIILKHNPQLKLDKLTIEHVKFVKSGEDKYQYPIYKKDDNGDYIVESIDYIELPFLRKEIVSIIDWLKQQNG